MTDASNNRVMPRRRAILSGRIFTDDGKVWHCLIRDISEKGARIKCDASPKQGLMVDIKVTKLNDILRAEVMWVRDGEIGLRFLTKIDTTPKSMARFFTLAKESGRS